MSYLLSLCYSFLIIKVEVIKYLTHRVDKIIKWDHVSELLSRMFDVVIKMPSLQPLHSLYYASSLTHLQVQSIKCPWRSTDKNALAVWRREQLIWLWGTYRFFKWRGDVCSRPWNTNKKGPAEMRWRPLGSRKRWGVCKEKFIAKGTCLYRYLKYLFLYKKIVYSLTAITRELYSHTVPLL